VVGDLADEPAADAADAQCSGTPAVTVRVGQDLSERAPSRAHRRFGCPNIHKLATEEKHR
jgi:hypothetical protein